jgi:4-hydroxy-tetrahydrodipicolinate reductase
VSGPRIVLAGATGRTGNAVAHALAGRDDVQLVACVAPSLAGTPTRPIPPGVLAAASVPDLPDDEWDVLVDLSRPDAAVETVQHAFERNKPVVLGTTGIPHDELERLGELARERQLGLLYVPNFSIAAVLLMRMGAELAEHFHSVEVVETHHDTKLDSPSGTARRTAQLLAAAGGRSPRSDEPSRGLDVDGVRVHSLRLPGATAHQEIVFGARGEVITLRHDAIDRSCYAGGVALAARGVGGLVGLSTGLEHVL